MITQQEKDNILQGFHNIQISIDRMLSMLQKYEEKKNEIQRILETRFSYTNADGHIYLLLKWKPELEELKIFYSIIPPIDNSISNQYKTFLQSEITQFNPNNLPLLQQGINNLFKDNFLHEKQNITNLISEMQNITSASNIQALYNETIALINSFIEHRDYNSALRFVNFKGRLTKDIAQKTIVNKYENRILDLIKKEDDLQKHILDTYFVNFVFE